ncbi:uncharacterized protein METZ01_LOCUS356392 [marine metagenome]|uniref:Uncharacterized protein n=1 Tax=marine metagenome TaxID=408172 RepID=A0A382S333_9ZZZZ
MRFLLMYPTIYIYQLKSTENVLILISNDFGNRTIRMQWPLGIPIVLSLTFEDAWELSKSTFFIDP